MKPDYDLIIVGAGMFGSSAARHAPAHLSVCIIGPAEPKGPPEHGILASHYDEGRIVNVTMKKEFMPLVHASIQRFPQLEKESGIQFYNPVGFLYITDNKEDLKQKKKDMDETSYGPVEDFSAPAKFKERFPYLRLQEDEGAIFETGGAGYISPRRFVEAQLKVAGCTVLRDVVQRLVQHPEKKLVEVITEGGKTLWAKQTLLCTGAFTHLRDLLPSVPPYIVMQETVSMVEVSADEAHRLREMPAMIQDSLSATPVYILPPIQYPDGKWYVKIGDSGHYSKEIRTEKDIQEWFGYEGNAEVAKKLAILLPLLIADLQVKSVKPGCCVSSHSKSTLPYIDVAGASGLVGVAAVGNYMSAKLSDEIGRLAVVLLTEGYWDTTASRELFKLPQ